jgi:hypothetical protein
MQEQKTHFISSLSSISIGMCLYLQTKQPFSIDELTHSELKETTFGHYFTRIRNICNRILITYYMMHASPKIITLYYIIIIVII